MVRADVDVCALLDGDGLAVDLVDDVVDELAGGEVSGEGRRRKDAQREGIGEDLVAGYDVGVEQHGGDEETTDR